MIFQILRPESFSDLNQFITIVIEFLRIYIIRSNFIVAGCHKDSGDSTLPFDKSYF